MKLKDGSEVEDPRLDRVEQFDERSRDYPIMATIAATKKPRSYHWSCGSVLDQGREGACVGFAWTHELIARPAVVKDKDDRFATSVYKAAQKIDQWPGENYAGTSVIAGVKVLSQQGFYGEYRWAFGLDDLVMAIGYKGPAVLGIPWYKSMYSTDKDYWVKVSGRKVGGHAILARGVNVRHEYVTLHNSWGPSWGKNGDGRISFDDLDRLLNEGGEACIPVKRFRP